MTSFVCDTFISLLLLYATGAVLLHILKFPWRWAVLGAPAASLCVYALLGEAYYSANIVATPLSVFVIPLCILMALDLASNRLKRKEMELPEIDWRLVILYCTVGIVVGGFFFLRSLPSYDAVFQSEDIAKHALQIRAFVDSGKFTSFHASIYLDNPDNVPFFNVVSFYPCAWHILCALVVQLGGGSVPTAMNAVNFLLAFLVYPLSTLALFSTIFDNRRSMLPIGAIACVSVIAFPWTFLIFGPLFPNLCGNACIPVVAALFIYSTSPETRKAKGVTSRIVSLLICGLGMALIHPNTVFSAAVLLIPYCCWLAAKTDICLFSYSTTSRQRTLVAAAFFSLVWIVLRYSRVFRDVAEYNWPAFVGPWQAFINILSLAYTDGFLSAAQPLVAIAVFMGCTALARDRRLGWLPVSYALACFISLVCMSTEGQLKHLLGGFWYTDPFRLAATAGIIAAPLVTIGLYQLEGMLCIWLKRIREEWTSHESIEKWIPYLAAAILSFVIFSPSFKVPGCFSIESAFSAFRITAKEQYSLDTPYSEREYDFVDKAMEIIGDDTSPVINNPLDGSLLAYGLNDLRCYYRNRWGYEPVSERPESYLIRKRLCDISDNEDVQRAVSQIGAHYVIILDKSEEEDSFLQWYWYPERFTGITNITPETPGFELLLEDNGMQLYRIVD